MSDTPSQVIDWNTLNEIISMDEDDPEFSKMLIVQYIDQAETTFDKMQHELDSNKSIPELNSLGHFLKGSSATLGLQRVASICEKIQNLGKDAALTDAHTQQCLHQLSLLLPAARQEFALARKELSSYYNTEL